MKVFLSMLWYFVVIPATLAFAWLWLFDNVVSVNAPQGWQSAPWPMRDTVR